MGNFPFLPAANRTDTFFKLESAVSGVAQLNWQWVPCDHSHSLWTDSSHVFKKETQWSFIHRLVSTEVLIHVFLPERGQQIPYMPKYKSICFPNVKIQKDVKHQPELLNVLQILLSFKWNISLFASFFKISVFVSLNRALQTTQFSLPSELSKCQRFWAPVWWCHLRNNPC